MAKEIASDFPRLSNRQSDMELKTVLKRLIRERGITIAHLSRTTKVPLQTLHGWLQGAEPKSFKQVKVIADYFDVNLDYLCFDIKLKHEQSKIEELQEEINAGVYEVVLRRIKK